MPDTKRTATGVLGGLAGLVGLSVVAGVLVTATVTPAIAVSGAAASSAITMFDNLPNSLKIDQLMLPTTIYYTDKETDTDHVLTKFWDQNRDPVDYDGINQVMYDAILSSEDPRYYEHGGVDLIGTTRAVLTNLRGGSETQGGSSISQQYVKNVLVQRCEADAETYEDQQACFTAATQSAGTEGIQRKLQEMRYAISLEQKYSKNDILLGYLNIANFGGSTYGIGAAAQYYFNTPASELSIGQSATLAGIVQNPNTYRIDQPDSETNGKANGEVEASDASMRPLARLVEDGTITEEEFLTAADPYSQTKGRQLYVIERMLDEGKITRDQFVKVAKSPINPTITPAKTGCAAAGGSAYFCQYVKSVIETNEAFGSTRDERLEALKRGGLNIYTTLDLGVQLPAEQSMAEWAPKTVDGMNFGAATVSIEAKTGRILSMTQNTTFSEDLDLVTRDKAFNSQVYAADEDHGSSIGFSVGSTYKLFTLIDWLEKGHSLNEVLNGSNRVFNKFTCDGGAVPNTTKIGNFGNSGGGTSTVMNFTAQSLNSGYLAMAEKLNLCDINRVADRMGVTLGTGEPVTGENVPFDILGSKAIAPLAMASAYATIANNGVRCEPKAIDKVIDSEGREIEPPKSSCEQVIAPEIAATAAFALQGVMRGGGTGSASNPNDGTPMIGKTGTNNEDQTMMIESSTEVTTAVWVGNVEGFQSLYDKYFNGRQLSQLRHAIAPTIARAANARYPGGEFPSPDPNLTRQVLTKLPDVVGQPMDQARRTLEGAGFQVVEGGVVDSTQAEGTVGAQTPGPGRVAGGTTVTISPSNGQGVTVPDTTGMSLEEAKNELRGFSALSEKCREEDDAPSEGRVTGTNPSANTLVNRSARITITYESDSC